MDVWPQASKAFCNAFTCQSEKRTKIWLKSVKQTDIHSCLGCFHVFWLDNTNFQVDLCYFLHFYRCLDRVESLDADNRLVRQERQEISLNINSNAALVGTGNSCWCLGWSVFVSEKTVNIYLFTWILLEIWLKVDFVEYLCKFLLNQDTNK